MKRAILTSITVLFGFMLAGPSVQADGEKYPNPHWDRTKCLSCHTSIPEPGSGTKLKYEGDYIALCNSCHETVSRDKYIHAVAMIPPEDQLERMPEDFRKAVLMDKGGRLTCIVCHQLKYQCLSSEYYRKESDPRFFRGGPYAHRSDICYNCHDRAKYERINPHDQISDEGDLMTDRCLYCHEEVPDRRKVRSIADVKFVIGEDLNRLCIRCHSSDLDRMGCVILPDGRMPDHMVKPSSKVAEKIRESKREHIMPLEPSTGKIFCGTCHNPHSIGVQRISKADKGAESHKRVRMRLEDWCTVCHGKEFRPVAPITPEKHPRSAD